MIISVSDGQLVWPSGHTNRISVSNGRLVYPRLLIFKLEILFENFISFGYTNSISVSKRTH